MRKVGDRVRIRARWSKSRLGFKGKPRGNWGIKGPYRKNAEKRKFILSTPMKESDSETKEEEQVEFTLLR